MQPTQNSISNYQPSIQVADLDSSKKRPLEESLLAATGQAFKKRKTGSGPPSPLQNDQVTQELSPYDSRLASQVEASKNGISLFAPSPAAAEEYPPGLQGEILLCIDEEIKKMAATPENEFRMSTREQVLSRNYALRELALANRLNEAIKQGEHQGFSIPIILAAKRKWPLLEKMVQAGYNIDYNSTPLSGSLQGCTIFLVAVLDRQWNFARSILKSEQTIDINAQIMHGALAGVNALFMAAAFLQWDLVSEIVKKHPNVNVNCRLSEKFGKVPLNANVLGLACIFRRWDIVKLLVEQVPNCEVDMVFDTVLHQGVTPLCAAAMCDEWDCFFAILSKNIHQNINASFTAGVFAGQTPLYSAASKKRWDIVSKILDLCPHASVNASNPLGSNKGATPLLLAADDNQWDLVDRMLDLQRDADVDAALAEGKDAGITPFWHATQKGQWPITLKMLSLKPRLNLECADVNQSTPLVFALNTNQWGIVKLFLIMGAKNPAPEFKFPTIMGRLQCNVSGKIIVAPIRRELDQTRSRIYDTLYNQWNKPSDTTFTYIRSCIELRSQIACEILLAEHPDIPNLPILPTIIEEWANLDARRNEAAKKRTAILAYREFRWNNGVFVNPSARTNEDIRNMILDTLSGVERSYAFNYSKEMRKKIVKSIGEIQETTPRLNPSLVSKAVVRAVLPHNLIPA